MIRKFKVEDITRIMQMDDHVEDSFPCDKGQWVQWLISIVNDPRYLVIGTDKSYLVAVDAVMPPVSNSVNIIFCFSKDGSVAKMKDAVSEWAIKQGAKRVYFITSDISVFKQYGVKKICDYGGWDI